MSDLGNKEIMAKNIKRYMDQCKVSRTELAKAINAPYSTVSDWLQANNYPRIDKIELMAKYFGVTKADLVERHDPVANKGTVAVDVDEETYGYLQSLKDRSEMRMLFKSADGATKEQIEAIVNLLDSMKGQE